MKAVGVNAVFIREVECSSCDYDMAKGGLKCLRRAGSFVFSQELARNLKTGFKSSF